MSDSSYFPVKRKSPQRKPRKKRVEFFALWLQVFVVCSASYASFTGKADFILTLRPECRTRKAFARLKADYGLSAKFSSPLHGMSPVRIGSGVSPEVAAQTLRLDSRIIHVEPDLPVRTAAIPDDPLFDTQWGLHNAAFPGADIDALDAWRLSTGAKRVIVAIIDTGIDYVHPDLAANMWRNPGEIPGNGRDDDHNGYIDDYYGWSFAESRGDPIDRHFHGTHVGGIVGAVTDNGIGVAGVMHRVSLMALKGLGDAGYGYSSDLIAAIYYAVDNGARVINASWGSGGFLHAMQNAIAYARDHNVLFVAAAGNWMRNNDIAPFYPASYPLDNVISVAASDTVDGPTHFTHWGPVSVDIAAPGIEITSTTVRGGYLRTTGTSQASPFVAGVVGLMISFAPHLGYNEYRSILLDNVRKTSRFRNLIASDGVVDAHQTLRDLVARHRPVQAEVLRSVIDWQGIGKPAGDDAGQAD